MLACFTLDLRVRLFWGYVLFGPSAIEGMVAHGVGKCGDIGLCVVKWWYFGDLLPNTYYAKVDEPRWSQGFDYL